MKSQGNRFLRCIPAVRFGLHRRLQNPHDAGQAIRDHARETQDDCSVSSTAQHAMNTDAPILATPPCVTIAVTIPAETGPRDSRFPAGQRAEMSPQDAKVILLPRVQSAHDHGRHVREKAQGPAVVVPVPPRGPLASGRDPLPPQAPPVVEALQGYPARGSSESQNRPQEVRSSVPRGPEEARRASMKRSSRCKQEGKRWGCNDCEAFGPRHSQNTGKSGKPPREPTRKNHVPKSTRTRTRRIRTWHAPDLGQASPEKARDRLQRVTWPVPQLRHREATENAPPSSTGNHGVRPEAAHQDKKREAGNRRTPRGAEPRSRGTPYVHPVSGSKPRSRGAPSPDTTQSR